MNKLKRILKSVLVMFAIFFTSLTIANHLLINFGYLNRFFMGNIIFGVALSFFLSIIFVLLNMNNSN